MKNISKLFGLTFLSALMAFTLIAADGVQAKDRRGDGRPDIVLTDAQKEKAQEILSKYRESTRELRDTIREKREELDKIMDSANPDRARIEALSAELGVLNGKRLLSRVDLRAELEKEGLPPELAKRGGPDKGKKMKEDGRRGEKRGDKKSREKRD